MNKKLPVVCIFGAADIQLKSDANCPSYETSELDCYCFPDDRDLQNILREYDPHVIVTIGEEASYRNLMSSPYEIRRRWLNFPDTKNLDAIGQGAWQCYLGVCLNKDPAQPLVSIFTPTYRTGIKFARALQSVVSQSYPNWEWIILDDSDDNLKTYNMLVEMTRGDHRIRVLPPRPHSGIIGEVKYTACSASRGDLLVELDHDDELVPTILWDLVRAAQKYPQCGFFYTDCAEVATDLSPLTYGEGWGWGYGSYRWEEYKGRRLAVTNAANVNAKTIRGLVAAPNHIRCWRRDLYFQIGGHNRMIHVSDDMELMVRTFLKTIMCRVPKFGYVQYMDGNNTQTVRNQDIQRHVRWLKVRYDQQIHDRFVELGVDDWIWNEEHKYSDFGIPNPEVEPYASIIAELD